MSRYAFGYKQDRSIMHLNKAEQKKIWPRTDACHTLSLVFGFDHALGLFFQLFNTDEEVVEEASTRFDGLSKTHLIELVVYYGDQDERNKIKDALDKLALDLPF